MVVAQLDFALTHSVPEDSLVQLSCKMKGNQEDWSLLRKSGVKIYQFMSYWISMVRGGKGKLRRPIERRKTIYP